MISVLNTKCNVLENTIKIFTDALDPNTKIDEGPKKQVSNLASKFPLEIPDVHAFIEELEVFQIFLSSLVESEGKIQHNLLQKHVSLSSKPSICLPRSIKFTVYFSPLLLLYVRVKVLSAG